MVGNKRAVIAWEAPPGHPDAHEPLAEELKGKPKEWGHILTYRTASTSASVAGQIRTGISKCWQPRGAFEAIAKKVDGEYRVYARYVGGGDA